MYTGYETFDVDRKNAFQQMVQRESRNNGANPREFQSFFGKSYAEFAREGHNTYGYKFSREAGSDLAMLLMLGKGFSVDAVFSNDNRPEMVQEKIKAGEDLVDLLDTEGPEVGFNQSINFDDFAGRIQPDHFDAGEYHVNRIMYKNLIRALPALQTEIEALTEQVDFLDPMALDTPEGQRLLRLSAFCFDIYQELTRGDSAKLAMEDEFAEYNRTKAPEEPELSYGAFGNFVAFSSIARYKMNYDRAVDAVLTDGFSEDRAGVVNGQAVILHTFLDTYQKNKRNHPEWGAFSLVPEKETVKQSGAIFADSDEIKADLFKGLQDTLGPGNYIDELTSGGYLRESAIPNVSEEYESHTMYGFNINYKNKTVTALKEEKPEVERRLERYNALQKIQDQREYFDTSSDKMFLALTGMKKQDFFKGTTQFGYALSRQGALSFMICDLLSKNVSMEEILDPNAQIEKKKEAAATLRSMIENHGYKEGSAEYIDQKKTFEKYAVRVYQGALPMISEGIKDAYKNTDLFTKPNLLTTTAEGRKAIVFCDVAFDSNQELSLDGAKEIIDQTDPTLFNKVRNLGAACTRIRYTYDMNNSVMNILKDDASNGAIVNVIRQKAFDMAFKKITNGNPDFDYANNYSYTNPEMTNAYTLFANANSFYEEKLKTHVEMRYSKEQLSHMIADGTFSNSIQIQEQNGKITSMTVLGMKADLTPEVKNRFGEPIGSDLSLDARKSYLKEVVRLRKALNKTESVFNHDNTEEFRNMKNQLNSLEEKLSDPEFTFSELTEKLSTMDDLAKDYNQMFPGNDQTKSVNNRKRVMSEIESLSSLASNYVQYPDRKEYKSLAVRNVIKERFSLEEKILPENPDGLDLLSERAKASYKKVYDVMMSGKDPEGAELEALKTDLKVITLHKFVTTERSRMGEEGYIANTVQNNKGQLDNLIQMMVLDGMEKVEALKNPTFKNVTKMFRDNLIEELITNAIDEVKRVENKQKQAEKNKQSDKEKEKKKDKALKA